MQRARNLQIDPVSVNGFPRHLRISESSVERRASRLVELWREIQARLEFFRSGLDGMMPIRPGNLGYAALYGRRCFSLNGQAESGHLQKRPAE